jgi:hypothetical protein
MICPQAFTVGEYRDAAIQFETLYPRSQFDWDAPRDPSVDISGSGFWFTEPRSRLISNGRIEVDSFDLTALSVVSVGHRASGEQLGMVSCYLSETYHQNMLFPDDFNIREYLRAARLVSNVGISLELFAVYPLNSASNDETVISSLEKYGFEKDTSDRIAEQAARAAHVFGVLLSTSASVDLRMLDLT